MSVKKVTYSFEKLLGIDSIEHPIHINQFDDYLILADWLEEYHSKKQSERIKKFHHDITILAHHLETFNIIGRNKEKVGQDSFYNPTVFIPYYHETQLGSYMEEVGRIYPISKYTWKSTIPQMSIQECNYMLNTLRFLVLTCMKSMMIQILIDKMYDERPTTRRFILLGKVENNGSIKIEVYHYGLLVRLNHQLSSGAYFSDNEYEKIKEVAQFFDIPFER